MLRFIIIWWVLWWLIGYGVAYARLADAKMISELRANYKKLQDDFQVAVKETSVLHQENTILRSKAQDLLDENEDYIKIVSELSRYYYHLKQANEKIEELRDILAVSDGSIEKKIMDIDVQDIQKKVDIHTLPSNEKKFF